jgi:hypothetical protein
MQREQFRRLGRTNPVSPGNECLAISTLTLACGHDVMPDCRGAYPGTTRRLLAKDAGAAGIPLQLGFRIDRVSCLCSGVQSKQADCIFLQDQWAYFVANGDLLEIGEPPIRRN